MFEWKKAVKKTLVNLVQIGVSIFAQKNLARYGVTVDPVTVAGSIFLGLDHARNQVKVRFDLPWL